MHRRLLAKKHDRLLGAQIDAAVTQSTVSLGTGFALLHYDIMDGADPTA